MQRTYLKKLKAKSYSSYNQRFYADEEKKVQEILEEIDKKMEAVIDVLEDNKEVTEVKKAIEVKVEEALGDNAPKKDASEEESGRFRIRTPQDRIIARKLINYYLRKHHNVKRFSKYDDSLSSYLAKNYYELGRKLYYRYHNDAYKTYALKDVFRSMKRGFVKALEFVRQNKDKILIGLLTAYVVGIGIAFSIGMIAFGAAKGLSITVWYAGIGAIASATLIGIVMLLSSFASSVLDNTIIHELNTKIASQLGDKELVDSINRAFKGIKEEVATIFKKLHDLWKRIKQYKTSLRNENKDQLPRQLKSSLNAVQESMQNTQSGQYIKFVFGNKELALNDSKLFDEMRDFLDNINDYPPQGYKVHFYCYKKAFDSGVETLLNKTKGEGLSKDAIESINQKLSSNEGLVKSIVVKSSADIAKEKDSFLDLAPYLFIGKMEIELFGGRIKIVYDIHKDAVNRVGYEDKYNAMVSAWLIQTEGE